MRFPLVLDLVADGIPVAVTCRTLGFSKQAFYQWKANPVTNRDWDDAHLIDAAMAIHADDPAFGYRFISDELPDHGIRAGENRVHRLCSAQGLFSVHSKKRGLNRRARDGGVVQSTSVIFGVCTRVLGESVRNPSAATCISLRAGGTLGTWC